MKRYGSTAALLLALTFVPLAPADEEFDTLQEEFSQAQLAWYEELEAAKQDDGTIDESKLPPHPTEKFLPRFKAYAEKHAGKPEAIPALVWIIYEAGASPSSNEGDSPGLWAVQTLTRDHAAHASERHIAGLSKAVYFVGAEPLIALYERVIEVNKDKHAAAWATFNLGCTHYCDMSASAEEDAPGRIDRALKLFQRTVKEYAGTKAAEAAAGYIYEIEHLQIGMKAPEIVGADADGKEIKLSQFRGQVVVLDFWGFW